LGIRKKSRLKLVKLHPRNKFEKGGKPLNQRKVLYFFVFSPLFGFANYGIASQKTPDAGQIIEQLNESRLTPKEGFIAPIVKPKVHRKLKHGGMTVKIKEITISGNTVFSDQELLTHLNATGKEYDFSDIRSLAIQIMDFYQAKNYPFSKAFIPAQRIEEGKLHIEVIEGYYGKSSVFIDNEDKKYTESAEMYLAILETGKIIRGDELERATLILSDQPGYYYVPVIRPGKNIGEGDLIVNTIPQKKYGGKIHLDNNGNRYTGKGRIELSSHVNGSLTFGDKIDSVLVYTEEHMWFGSMTYGLPLNPSGLRGNISGQRTAYELGKEFESLEAYGTAEIISFGMSYPIIRSQRKNLSISTTFQKKWLKDVQGLASSTSKKSSQTIGNSLNYDYRDSYFGGGITYGAISWTHGKVKLDDNLMALDRVTANTAGVFDKINLDIARIQALPFKDWSLYLHITAQKSYENLDSSEDFGLGGPNGVRAYPTGESYGDEGILGQVELRHTYNNNLNFYLFYDYGHTKTNKTTWSDTDNDRSIGGAGVGIRANYGQLNADSVLAWRHIGGDPQSDSRITIPMFWLNISYNF
jgi:hemolysin activation/secretion protein